MALSVAKNTVLEWNKPTEKVENSVNTAGMAIDYTNADNKIVLYVDGAGTVTVSAGNGVQGGDEMKFTVTAAAFIVLESGMFKQMSGEETGKVLIKPSAAVKVSVVVLP